MPWNATSFPPAMQHLGEAARAKAIEIANALLAQGIEEGKAIRIAIARAKEWAWRHGYPVRDEPHHAGPRSFMRPSRIQP